MEIHASSWLGMTSSTWTCVSVQSVRSRSPEVKLLGAVLHPTVLHPVWRTDAEKEWGKKTKNDWQKGERAGEVRSQGGSRKERWSASEGRTPFSKDAAELTPAFGDHEGQDSSKSFSHWRIAQKKEEVASRDGKGKDSRKGKDRHGVFISSNPKPSTNLPLLLSGRRVKLFLLRNGDWGESMMNNFKQLCQSGGITCKSFSF